MEVRNNRRALQSAKIMCRKCAESLYVIPYSANASCWRGESGPSNVSCVNNSSATKGEALGGIGSRSGAPQGKGRKLCEVELSRKGLELLSEVEQTFNKRVVDQWYKDMIHFAAASIAVDGTLRLRSITAVGCRSVQNGDIDHYYGK